MPDVNLLNKHALTEQFSTSIDNIQEWHAFRVQEIPMKFLGDIGLQNKH